MYLHVPPYILFDRRLDPTKKILLSYILSLSKTLKGCYASNERFGELFNINPDGASKQVSQLKRLGYIETKIFYKNYKSVRTIKVVKQLNIEQSNNLYINIPYSVLFDDKLSSTQKQLLSEILVLSELEQGCIKSNREFGELLGVGTSAIFKQIKKLVEMDYIIINEEFKQRKIELTSSYITKRFVPKSQNGCSQITKCFVPKSQNGYSCRNTINTINNTIEIVQVLTQFTSTEKIVEKSEIEILEEKIIDSCSQGQELLNQFKRNWIENIRMFATTKQEIENINQLYKEYKVATKNLEINKPLNEDVSETNDRRSLTTSNPPPGRFYPLP
jgi:Mn-dependent DtxR family transcriptional regulator